MNRKNSLIFPCGTSKGDVTKYIFYEWELVRSDGAGHRGLLNILTYLWPDWAQWPIKWRENWRSIDARWSIPSCWISSLFNNDPPFSTCQDWGSTLHIHGMAYSMINNTCKKYQRKLNMGFNIIPKNRLFLHEMILDNQIEYFYSQTKRNQP